MKVELIKNDTNKTVGWKLVAETKEDKLRLGTIRNMEFFGLNDTVITYDGMKTDPEDENYVVEVLYATKGHQKERKEAFRKMLEEKRNENNT